MLGNSKSCFTSGISGCVSNLFNLVEGNLLVSRGVSSVIPEHLTSCSNFCEMFFGLKI